MLAQAAVKGYNAMSVEIMWKQTRRKSKVSRRALETLESEYPCMRFHCLEDANDVHGPHFIC